jgi:hypothetical protein
MRAEVQGVFEHEGTAAVKYHHDHIEDAHTSRERLLAYVHARNSLVCLSWPITGIKSSTTILTECPWLPLFRLEIIDYPNVRV